MFSVIAHNTIIGFVAGIALVTGLVANIRNYGIAIGIAYAIFVIASYIFIIWNIRCVLYGSCESTAWWNVCLAVVTFGTLAYYYITNLQVGDTIAPLKDQPIIGVNPLFRQFNTQINRYTNVDLLNYTEKVHNKILSRPSSSNEQVITISASQSASIST